MDSNQEGIKLLNDTSARFIRLVNNNLKKSKEIIFTSQNETQKDLLKFKKEIILIEKEIGNLNLKEKHNLDNFMKLIEHLFDKIDEISNEDISEDLTKINELMSKLEILELEALELDDSNNLSELKNRLNVYKTLQIENFDFKDSVAVNSKITELKSKQKELEIKMKKSKVINGKYNEFLLVALEKICSLKFDNLNEEYLNLFNKISELMTFIKIKQEYFSNLSSELKTINKITFKKVDEVFPVPEQGEATHDPRIDTVSKIKKMLSETNYLCSSLKTLVSQTEIDLLKNNIESIKTKIEEYLYYMKLQNEFRFVCYCIEFYSLDDHEKKSNFEKLQNKIFELEKHNYLNESKYELTFPDLKFINEKLNFIEYTLKDLPSLLYRNFYTQVETLKSQDSSFQDEIKVYLLELKNQIGEIIRKCVVDLRVQLVDDEVIKLDGDAF
jgi:hypothetical protein